VSTHASEYSHKDLEGSISNLDEELATMTNEHTQVGMDAPRGVLPVRKGVRIHVDH
jgi:hypothetical protein